MRAPGHPSSSQPLFKHPSFSASSGQSLTVAAPSPACGSLIHPPSPPDKVSLGLATSAPIPPYSPCSDSLLLLVASSVGHFLEVLNGHPLPQGKAGWGLP